MRDYHTQQDREKAVARSKEISEISQVFKSVPISRDTFKRLESEINEMPFSEVESLPKDLQDWILVFRPELKRESEKQEIEQPAKLTNWIDIHRLKHGELPLIPEFIVPLVKDFTPGAKVSKGIELNYSPPYWDNLKPSQRKQILQLVEWLGQDKDDYIDMINRLRPGRPSDIRVHWKR